MIRFHAVFFLVIITLLGITIFSGVVFADEELVSGSNVDVTVDGSGVVQIQGSTVTVWASESFTVYVGPTHARANEHYIYCLDIDGTRIDCPQGTLAESEGIEFDFEANQLSSGSHTGSARIHEDQFGFTNPEIEEIEFSIRVITKTGDFDDDGLSNQEEINQGTEFDDPDTDGDGLDDGEELNQHSTDPLSRDTDGDGVRDGAEVQSHGTDPTDDDSDNDGLDDYEEIFEYGTEPTIADTDGDGYDDGAEVQQGSDPTDTDDTPESDDEDTSTPEPSTPGSDSDESNVDPEDSTSDDSPQRGFFTNNPESEVEFLMDPFNITIIGFVLSVLGILLELRRGS